MEQQNTSIGAKLMSIALIAMGIFLGFYAFFANATSWNSGIYQSQSWTIQLSGDSLEMPYQTIATDNSGNIYVAGTFDSGMFFGSTGIISTGSDDIFVAKIDKNHTPLWIQRAGGDATDIIYDMKLDTAGNIYLAGGFRNTGDFGSITLVSSGGSDMFFAKISSTGNRLRAQQAGGISNDQGHALALDNSGNMYIAGMYFGSDGYFGPYTLTNSGNYDISIAKLDSNGNRLRAQQAGGTGGDVPNSLSLDTLGNIYLAGYFSNTADFGSTSLTSSGINDIFVAKMDATGNRLRAKKAGGTGGDVPNSLSLDTLGNIYLAGYFSNTADFGSTSLTSSGINDIFVAKMDATGNRLRAKKAGGTGGDVPNSLSLDTLGNIYLAGYFSNTADFGSTSLTSSGINDIFVAKMDATGNRLRAKKAGGINDDLGMGTTMNSSGEFFVIGYFDGTADFGSTSLTSLGSSDIFISKFVFDNESPIFTGTTQAGVTVVSGGLYNTGVSFFFSDVNLSGATLNGSSYALGTLITGDGTYIFFVEDTANNSTGTTFTIDRTAPTFTGTTLSSINVVSGGYYNTGISITFDDLHLSGAVLNGAPYTSGQIISTQGSYIFLVIDTLGNSTGMSFIIDSIAPTLTGAISSTYYNHDIIITGSDDNAFSGFIVNGMGYIGNPVTISTDGVYTVTGYDYAGNTTEITSFTIDKITPTVSGATNGGYYNTNITITGNDTNFSGFILNGIGYGGSSLIVTGEGIKSLTGVDYAGNFVHISFTIDTTNPTIIGITSGAYYSGNRIITGTDNFAFQGFMINGNRYTGSSITITGDAIWTVTGYDYAGNYSTGITFTLDKTAPIFTGTTLSLINVVHGGYYNTGISITFDDLHLSGAVLNGAPYTSGQIISTQGSYIFLVIDTLGNSTGMSFIIDTTNPIVTGNYPTSGLVYTGGTLTYKRSGYDAIDISGYTLYVTGTVNHVLDLGSASTGYTDLTLTNGTYIWYVVITDRAGNTGMSAQIPFTIQAPLLPTILMNTGNLIYNGLSRYSKDYVSIYLRTNKLAAYSFTGDITTPRSGNLNGAFTGNFQLSGSDGIKHIYLLVTDGITTGRQEFIVNLDTAAPTLPSLISPISGAAVLGTFVLDRSDSIDAGAGTSGFQYFIYSTGLYATLIKSGFTNAITSLVNITNGSLGSDGAYYRYVKVLDKLGNLGSTAMQRFNYSGILDTMPDTFSFTHITSATIDHIYGSNTITITGLSANTPVLATITSGALYISGHMVGTTGYVQNGWTVKIEMNSSDEYDTDVSSVLTIGGVSATFTITTETEAEAGTNYSDIVTNLSNTEKLMIISIFETLKDLYAGDKEQEFFNTLMVMLDNKMDDFNINDPEYDALKYLYDLAKQYYDDADFGNDISTAPWIINGVYTAPNGKKYTITYDSVKKFTSTNFITPKYYPTLDVLKYDIDRNNPLGSSYLNAKTIKARWGRLSLDGTRQTSAYTAPNRKVFYFFKTTEGQYSSYTFTTERYFDSLEAVKEFIHNTNKK